MATFTGSQRQPWMAAASTSTSSVVHVIIIYITYYLLDWGLYAIYISTSFMFTTRFIVMFTLAHYSDKIPKYVDIKIFSR
jgi:Na+-driven multidrug efflux pump